GPRPATAPRPRRALAGVVALAEFELESNLLDLPGGQQGPDPQHALEGGQPGFVVAKLAGTRFRRAELADQRLANLLPGEAPLLRKGHGHAEHAPLPRSIEDQLPVAARHRAGPVEVGEKAMQAQVRRIIVTIGSRRREPRARRRGHLHTALPM